jgi:hypothetical protein
LRIIGRCKNWLVETRESRDLSAEEVAHVAEVMELPPESRVLYTHSDGTYDGTRYDGIDPGALYDSFFYCPQSFDEAVRWLEARFAQLGWPAGMAAEAAPMGDIQTLWHTWKKGKEQVDLIDFTDSNWTGFDPPPAGWSMLRLNYSRKPARDFKSNDEYQAWFKDDSPDKGARWRNR